MSPWFPLTFLWDHLRSHVPFPLPSWSRCFCVRPARPAASWSAGPCGRRGCPSTTSSSRCLLGVSLPWVHLLWGRAYPPGVAGFRGATLSICAGQPHPSCSPCWGGCHHSRPAWGSLGLRDPHPHPQSPAGRQPDHQTPTPGGTVFLVLGTAAQRSWGTRLGAGAGRAGGVSRWGLMGRAWGGT